VKVSRLPLFCDTAMAQRIEQAQTRLVAEASEAARRRRADDAGFAIPVAGGVASFAEPGSPYNKVAGLGFGGIPAPAALAEIERAYAAVGASVQVELAHLGDPTIAALLTGRGYRLILFDNVLGLVLKGVPERVRPRGVEVRPSARRSSSRGWTSSTTASPIPMPTWCLRTRRSHGKLSPGRHATSRPPAACATSHCMMGS
jgi:hypothetical protein